MQNIANPKKIDFKSGETNNDGIVTVEPLFPGYGMTLGNSLRRVLLSSLSGAAVIGVKIKGANHEFMALPHVKEDVLELILNLKQLRLKMFTEEEVHLVLKVKGKKTVTAADITKNSDAEVRNTELVLGHITDDMGSLEIDIVVREGRGYKMAEASKKENREIGYMEIDSIFSPVTLVSIDVENTRVGKMTNWDKLILNIKTDGTITPEDAFNEAVKILVEQFNSLLSLKEDAVKEESAEEIIMADLVSEDEEVEKEEVKKEKKEKKEKVEKKEKKAKK
jgi:DNA-directed RNA polymerase subunit alpha